MSLDWISNSFAFLHFGIQPIVKCVCLFSLLLLFQGEVAYQNFTYQSLQKVGYFNITVKMLTYKEMLIPVGLMFSYTAHIEYIVARLREHTETFGIQ